MSKTRKNDQPVQEVSGPDLLDAIQLASSQDVQAMQLGSQRLKLMLAMSGVQDGLQEIAAHRELSLPIRTMAALQFKNLVLSHWRAKKNISEDHRARIRARCLSFIDEPDDTIANCTGIATAKIARNDFPKEWPTLLLDLSKHIDTHIGSHFNPSSNMSSSFLHLRRSLYLLNLVLKELCSVKMMAGVKNMSEVVQTLHAKFLGYYTGVAEKIVPHNVTPQSFMTPVVHEELLLCHLLHKIVAKMAAWMWSRLDKIHNPVNVDANLTWISQFFQTSSIQLRILVELRTTMIRDLQDSIISSPSLDRITRLTYAMGKFFMKLQRLSHSRFAQLPMCAETIRFYWSQVDSATESPEHYIQDSTNAVFPIRILVQGMQLFKDNLSQWAPTLKNNPNPNALPQAFVEAAASALITRFMRFSQRDLNSWNDDPESWYNTEETENELWQFEIRACGERVLMVLCNHFPDYCTPVILSLFQEVNGQDTNYWDKVLKKEALYCALGRCCASLAKKVPFQQWLEGNAYQEAQELSLESDSPISGHLLLRRRIAWLISKLIANDCISPTLPRVWEILVFILSDPNSDSAVRLTAFCAIGECVGGPNFDPNVLSPYLNIILSQSVSLLTNCTMVEVKRRVTVSMSNIFIECGETITPHMSLITAAIPQLWVDAGEQWVLKTALLETITDLVEAVKTAATSLPSILVPLIQNCLTPQSIGQLDEHALKLWSAALRNSTTIRGVDGSQTFFHLFPKIVELLETNMDLLNRILSIIESYFLLDATLLLEGSAKHIFAAFQTSLAGDVVTVNKKDLIDALCLLVQITPSHLWGETMHTSGLFTHLLMNLAAGEREAILLTHYIYLFARIILADRPMFCQLMSATALAQGVQEGELYDGLVNQWWQRFDNMSEPRHRKLTAMGVACLVATCRHEVLVRLSTEIFNIWLDVFGEIREATTDADDDTLESISPLNLRRLWELDEPHPSWYAGSEGTAEFDRRQLVYDQDPVRTAKMTTFISQRLQEAEQACPPPGLQRAYLADVDPNVFSQIQKELKETR